jgi:hypothetical protein
MAKPVSTLKRKCDIEFSNIIRSSGVCARCGKYAEGWNLHCAHIYTRGNHAIRWDPMNAIPLCAGCHRWGHDNPLDFATFIRDKYPGRYDYLQEAKDLIVRRRYDDYVELLATLKKRDIKALMVIGGDFDGPDS